jgi:formylglycine-generating enzyme required for sulfatase activity
LLVRSIGFFILVLAMQELIEAIADTFEIMGAGVRPQFRHRKTGIPFQYISGGEFFMGFSQEEERAALAMTDNLAANVEEMRPVKRAQVAPCLVASLPVLNFQVRPFGAAVHAAEQYDYYPAYFNRPQAANFASSLGCRLISEMEWEYCCRAGTKTLFVFGDALPVDHELERWLTCDFSQPERVEKNGFGLSGMFTPQWCADHYRLGYSDDAALVPGEHVIRGGGAYFWPWQDEEWVWCMSAMRAPSSVLINGEACLRLAFDLPSVVATPQQSKN